MQILFISKKDVYLDIKEFVELDSIIKRSIDESKSIYQKNVFHYFFYRNVIICIEI